MALRNGHGNGAGVLASREVSVGAGSTQRARENSTHTRNPEASGFVFPDEQGRERSAWGQAELFRKNLRAFGLHERRPKLFETRKGGSRSASTT